jgi:D-threo-aldose 1-dehydrogenase
MKTRVVGATGLSLSEISFGCAPIGGLYRECPEQTAMETLDLAWRAGIRYFDTAPFYGAGLSEERTGRFLRGKPRDEFVISTKVGRLVRSVSPQEAGDYGFVGARPSVIEYDYSRDGILRSIEASMMRTGLDRFDILYVHDIGVYAHGEEGNANHMRAFAGSGIAALNELRDSGVIKAWGLGVNETAICLDVLERTHMDCILLAGRYTLLDRRAEERLIPLCIERGTSLVIGGVFNSGILATGPVEGAHFDYVEAGADIRERVSRMQEIAVNAGTDLANAALQFPLHNPTVASVLIGSAKPSSLERNVEALAQAVAPSVFAACEPYTLR